MKFMRKAWITVPLLALTLSACSGESEGGVPATEVSGGSEAGDESTSDSSYVDITDQQGSAPNFEGAIDDASVERCEAADDGWISAGTVENPTDAIQNYRVYVAFNKNSDTRGLVQVDVEALEPGEMQDWSAQAPVSGEGLKCVLRVERFPNE